MSTTQQFDPYYKWLGIPPKDQPPNHYRLLGLERFEADREVIDAAANRLMAYLQDLATGDHGKYSQQLLNEVAAARVCLLDATRKAVYDARLEAKLAAEGPPPPPAPPTPPDPSAAAPPIATAEPFPGLAAASSVSRRITSPHTCPQCKSRLTARGAVCKTCGHDSAQVGSAQQDAAEETRQPAAPIIAVSPNDSSVIRPGRKRTKTAVSNSGSHPGLEHRRHGRKKSANTALLWIGVALAVVLAVIVLATQGGDPPENNEPAVPPRKSPPKPSLHDTEQPERTRRFFAPVREYQPPDEEPESFGSLMNTSAGPAGESGDRVMATPVFQSKEEPRQAAKPASDGPPRADAEKPREPESSKPKSPLRELTQSFQLPEMKRGAENGEATPLGTVDVPSGADLQLAIPENPDGFSVSATEGERGIRRWVVVMAKGEDGPPTPIARFSLVERELKFHWLPDGAGPPAERLRNCSLRLAAGDETKTVGLRSPQQVSPLAIRDRNQTVFTLRGLPPKGVPRLELLELSGPIRATSVLPEKVFESGRNATIALAGEQAAALRIRVWFQRDGSEKLVVRTDLGLGPRFVPFDWEEVEQEIRLLRQKIKYCEVEVAKSRRPNGSIAEDVQARYQQTRAPFDARLAVLSRYLSIAKTLRESSRLHFRIFAEVGGRQVEFVRSGTQAK